MKTKPNTQTENQLPSGLGQPALRALTGAGITRTAQLAKFTEAEISHLHGIGPTSIVLLRKAMAEQGIAFSPSKPKPASSKKSSAAKTKGATRR